jgi:hypothetical protein
VATGTNQADLVAKLNTALAGLGVQASAVTAASGDAPIPRLVAPGRRSLAIVSANPVAQAGPEAGDDGPTDLQRGVFPEHEH